MTCAFSVLTKWQLTAKPLEIQRKSYHFIASLTQTDLPLEVQNCHQPLLWTLGAQVVLEDQLNPGQSELSEGDVCICLDYKHLSMLYKQGKQGSQLLGFCALHPSRKGHKKKGKMGKMEKTHLSGVPFKNKIVLVSHSARNQHTTNKKVQIENQRMRHFSQPLLYTIITFSEIVINIKTNFRAVSFVTLEFALDVDFNWSVWCIHANKQWLSAILLNLTLRNKTKQNKNCLKRKGGNNKNLVRSKFRGEKGKKIICFYQACKGGVPLKIFMFLSSLFIFFLQSIMQIQQAD